MKSILSRFRDRVSDALFLEFYLDKHWTFRFKLMNLISGDDLRFMLTAAHNHLNKIDPQQIDPVLRLHVRRAKYWTEKAWNSWYK